MQVNKIEYHEGQEVNDIPQDLSNVEILNKFYKSQRHH